MAEPERGTLTPQPYYGLDPYGNSLVGIETYHRYFISNGTGTALTSQGMRLTYFTPTVPSPPVTKIIAVTGTTAAAATPTLCRLGLYSIASNGDGTLVASCANDTSMFSATATEYAASLASPSVYTLTVGQKYALAVLVVTGVALPTLLAVSSNGAIMGTRPPRLTALLTGQSDLPATFTNGSLSASVFAPYMALTAS